MAGIPYQKSVVYCFSILQQDYPEKLVTGLWYGFVPAYATIILRGFTVGMLDSPLYPFHINARPIRAQPH
ncbi:MAG: hypothetical protein ACYCY0_04655 [Acidithiobacillus ferrivorans]